MNKSVAAPPQQLRELPEHVRLFLASLEPDDIVLVKSGMDLAKWLRTTRRITQVLVVGGLSIFGAIIGVIKTYDWLIARFTSTKGGG